MNIWKRLIALFRRQDPASPSKRDALDKQARVAARLVEASRLPSHLGH